MGSSAIGETWFGVIMQSITLHLKACHVSVGFGVHEVAEQLNWQAPAHAIVPAASGSLHTKIWKGFKELEQLNLIPKVQTKMHLTQAEGCSPIAQAYQKKETHIRPVKPNTVA